MTTMRMPNLLAMTLPALTLASATLSACPDTEAQFDEYLESSAPFRKTVEVGECAGPVDLSGTYVLGAAVAVDPTKPIRFRFEVTVDLDNSAIDASLQAVAVPPNNGTTTPGTLVGAVYEATAELDASGKFKLDFGSIDVPLEANPILPAPVTATLQLEGCTSTPTAACGTVLGDITKPAAIPLAGSTWGIVPFADGADPSAVTLVTACPE